MSKLGTRCAAIAAFGCAVVGAATVAPQAKADQIDFLNRLDDSGIYYSSESQMVDIGKEVCSEARDGASGPIIKADLARLGYPSLTERAIIVTSAANTMCPDIWPVIDTDRADLTLPIPPITHSQGT